MGSAGGWGGIRRLGKQGQDPAAGGKEEERLGRDPAGGWDWGRGRLGRKIATSGIEIARTENLTKFEPTELDELKLNEVLDGYENVRATPLDVIGGTARLTVRRNRDRKLN